jgi:long-chain fatty acid transport protein
MAGYLRRRAGRRAPVVLCAAVVLASDPAGASGFQLKEQSVSGLGNAYAGAAAIAEDASTIFFNPAGMARLQGTQVQGNLHLIVPEGKYIKASATDTLGSALTGGNGGDGAQDALVPATYFLWDISPQWKFGLGLNSPFGLVTSYDDNWVGRYHAITSSLQTIDIQPSVAYKFSDQLSIGVGLQAQYAKARLTNAIDFGTVCLGSLSAATCTALGLLPQRAAAMSGSWATIGPSAASSASSPSRSRARGSASTTVRKSPTRSRAMPTLRCRVPLRY